MKLYRRFGIEFAARARGHFALAVWDGPAETLFLASDRFGMRPSTTVNTAQASPSPPK